MQISDIPNATRVGEIVHGTQPYSGPKHVFYKTKLVLNYDPSFPKSLKTKQLSMVYILCVDGEIYKIGQSSTKSGIQGCMNFYLNAGQDDPGINRFAINWLIRDELDKGSKVEVYMIYMEPIIVEVPGLFKTSKMSVPVSAKGIEETCLMQYNVIEDCYPKWNYQETGENLPNQIHEAFGQYKIDRKT
ncbi:hypothetical protein S-PM2d238, partial [Synechococcus phage S-PM2]